MNQDKKFLFLGNRVNALNVLLERGYDVDILAVKDSYITQQTGYRERAKSYAEVGSKYEAVAAIINSDFDILLSSGCPWILPVSKMKKDHQLFVNVHPSLLPDLKGIHPITGTVLFNRPGGASVHIMDDGIDTGQVLAQVEIPQSDDIRFVYQACFDAERRVFEKALNNGFQPVLPLKLPTGAPIYYSRKESDRVLDLRVSIDEIRRKVLALAMPGQYAYFFFCGQKVFVKSLEVLTYDITPCEPFKVFYSLPNWVCFNHFGTRLKLEIEYGTSSVRINAGDLII